MKTIVIVSNCIKDENLKLAEKIKNIIEEKEPEIEVRICELEKMSKDIFKGAFLALVLGGDGTMLRVGRDTCEYDVPLLGINLGNIGFLAEVEIQNIEKSIEEILKGRYTVEERMMLNGSVFGKECSEDFGNALNDIIISGHGDIQIIGYRLIVNDHVLNDFFADGILISTPTGSTGYNLSAGGPIVEPPASLMVITPVNPHTLTTRSIILSDKDKVEIKILPSNSNKSVCVATYFDGARKQFLSEGDRVVVTKAHKTVKLCKLSDMSFLEMLRRKLN